MPRALRYSRAELEFACVPRCARRRLSVESELRMQQVDSIPYQLVFDVTNTSYDKWWLGAIGLMFMVIGVLLVRQAQTDQESPRRTRRSGWFVILFSSIWAVLATWATYHQYATLTRAMRERTYVVAEGIVTDFKQDKRESFTVAGRTYGYSSHVVTSGFSQTARQGGPIRNGLRVRIADVNGHIARLEIQRACGVYAVAYLTDSAVGAVHLRRRVDEIGRVCEIVSDKTELNSEAMPQRIARFRVANNIVTAEVGSDYVWRIVVNDSTIRTHDLLGVGTTLGRLLEYPGVTGVTGEGGAPFVQVEKHCGLSFGLDRAADTLTSQGPTLDRRALQTAPPSSRVTVVLIVGCAFRR